MPKPQWTMQAQHNWLTRRIQGFLKAQEDKTVNEFFTATRKDWFKAFPTEVTPRDLENANGDKKKAEAAVTKTYREVSEASVPEIISTNVIASACLLLVLQSHPRYNIRHWEKRLVATSWKTANAPALSGVFTALLRIKAQSNH